MVGVPSSTPPSSPGRYSRRNDPSTTPAGPPPDRLFGSAKPTFIAPNSCSRPGAMFASSPPKNGVLEGIGSGSIRTSSSGRPTAQRGRTTSGGFHAPSGSAAFEDEHEDAPGEEDDDMDDDEYDDERTEDDDYSDTELSAQRRAKPHNAFSQSILSRTSASELEPGSTLVHAGAKQTHFDLLAIAKGLTPNISRITLHEPDYLVLQTERLAQKVHESLEVDTPDQQTDVLGDVTQSLVALWQAASKTKGEISSKQPGAADNLTRAAQLASLLLTLHHPPSTGHNQRTSALSLNPAQPDARHYTPIPKILLDWLNSTYAHVSEVDHVLKETHGYSRHASFWEAVQAAAVRGNFAQCVQLLQGANLEFAATAQEDGLGDTGYSGTHLRYANDAVRASIDLLRECPAVASGDWDIKGHDWSIFRQRVHQAYTNLQDVAEGDSASRHAMPMPFTASHFGISQSQANFQLSVASRKAESKVPWSVYENLRKLYQILSGNEEEVLSISADWIEAALGLTIWWNGEEEEDTGLGSLAASRRSIMRTQRVRSVDVTPVKAYCQRLSAALAAVIENSDEDFSVNTTDRFEVGIACIADDNVESLLQILSSWSLPLAATVAEIASAGEWFTRADGIMNQFDQSDLMVLSYNEQQKTGVSKDDFLVAYSKLLATKGQLSAQDSQASKEGWELAIQVLGRLDDSISASGRIEQMLNELPLESSLRVDKITRLCHELGLSQHALTIAQKYAEHLRTNTQNYGDTLLYYARAHDTPRIQEVLRVLVAHCLIKSIAYPPLSELDESLESLIKSPKQTLTKLSGLDPEAASLLSNHLSGYATIRKFYDLRDEEVLLKTGEKPAHRPMARKRAAANALSVIVASAASSIRGGLYDPEIETVVQVDVLLPLLGEALVFVNQTKRTLTLRHLYDLLAAIEDLDTVPSMIRSQCEEVLSTTLSAAHDPSNAQHGLLQKSTSNLTTASSQFSLIEFGTTDGQSAESSAVLVKGGGINETPRGWDWRRGFNKGANGQDVISVLRLGVAREIARAFVEGEVST
ncbi:Nup85 nucleoporin-domain-containing protein [Ampelomyces quisqualis]|uniref:Nuclear pore complex protein Nup85 n=1 Tax=Ampelomyces quisqualis TaxID=50730 RepID=A0A6A5QF47_AMPQU|nr:Nup85 nucleoporin-domain-containing protein [Ampelomyces quisqualis]